jgi:hypothetical protein
MKRIQQMTLTLKFTYLMVAGISIWLLVKKYILDQSEQVISYPTDILTATDAPIHQYDFFLEDAIFSSNFESGNLKSAV